MAKVKIKFRASSLQMREGALFYQVIHRRTARQISTGYRLYPQEWDGSTVGIILPSAAEAPERRAHLLSIQQHLEEDIARLEGIIGKLDADRQEYSADEVVEMFRKYGNGLVDFAQELIVQLRMAGKFCTAEKYTCAISSFLRFREDNDISLEAITPALISQYERYLKAEGLCPNTSSYYMRNLRAIYNRAVENNLTMQRKPFRYVYTGIDKTVKRAIPVESIRRIRSMDLSHDPKLDYARDMFMFSFYTRGMSFVDMAYLKKSDLRNGILSYRRQKTGQHLFIRWEEPMQEIVGKYDTSGSPYLLPIICDVQKDERRQYRTASHLVNLKLKVIGRILKLPIPLTSYVARHSWASIARSRNIPVATISEAMGHDSESTTRIYLASLDTSVIDNANRLIIRLL